MKTLLAALVLASAASGCVLMEPPTTGSAHTVPEADTCGAKPFAHLIGKPLTDPAVPLRSSKVRHIRPGDAVTEDLRIERLNFYVTGAGVIEMINCG